MKYVIRAAPILVALALFVSFLVIQQDNTARAAVIGLSLETSPGTAADNAGQQGVTDPSHVSSNENVAETRRTVMVTVRDDTVRGAAPAGYVTVKNDTQSITITGGDGTDDFRMTEMTPGVYTGSFVVTELPTDAAGHLEAEDGDAIQVTSGFLLASFTVDSDPPDMDDNGLVPGDGDISGDGLTSVSGKVTDDGAGVAEEDIFLVSGPVPGARSLIPASLVDFTETDAGDGFAFETFVNIATEGTQSLQVMAIDGAGNASFTDSDDDTDCVVSVVVGDALRGAASFTVTGCEANKFDVDTTDPDLSKVFTGLAFDEDSEDCGATTCNLDENKRDWLLAVFTDKNDLSGSSVDDEDFSVEDHDIKSVKWFDEDGVVTNVAADGVWDIRKLVFIQLEDELDADETPEVFLESSAGGVEDEASNINNSDSVGSEDRIGPRFKVDAFDPPASLVGDGVEVAFTITADEETEDKPDVTVFDALNTGATPLGTTVTSTGTNEWDVVVEEIPSDTATLYNVHISGEDPDGNASDLGIENVSVETAKTTGTFKAAGGTEVACTAAAPCIIDDGRNMTDVIDGEDCTTERASPVCVIADDGVVDGFFDEEGKLEDIDGDAIFFEGDNADLGSPDTVPADDDSLDIRSPFFLSLDWGDEGDEYAEDSHGDVDLLFAELDGEDVLASASTSDGSKWLIAIIDIELGEHKLVVNASDSAGNELTDSAFTLAFEVTQRDPIKVALSPGWNLISLPGNPVDSSIDAVMANSPAVEAVITYDPSVPGGFLVALRSEDGGDFSGNLETMVSNRGYWVLTDNFEPIEVDVPPLGTGAGVLPPSVPVAEGWNLLPVQDPTGLFGSGDALKAGDYFTSAEDVSAVYEFDTVGNAWVFIDITDTTTVDCDEETTGATVVVGRSYWAFSTASGTLVPVPISADATTADLSGAGC